MTAPAPRSQPGTMPVPVTELGPEALAERLLDIADLAKASVGDQTYLNDAARKLLRDTAARLIEIGKEAPRLRAELQDVKLQLANARKTLETIETRDRFWSAHPGSREVLEAAPNGNVRIRGEYGNIAHAALSQPEVKP